LRALESSNVKAACAKIISAERELVSTRHRYGNCRGEAANRRLGKTAARVLEESALRGPLFAAAFWFLHNHFIVDAD
jgi:hypothetical protein